MRAAALLAALAAAVPVAAQDVPFSAEATETCLAAAADRPAKDACVGPSADASGESQVHARKL